MIKKKVHLSVETNLHWQSIFKISGCCGQIKPALCLPWLIDMAEHKKIRKSNFVIKQTLDKIHHQPSQVEHFFICNKVMIEKKVHLRIETNLKYNAKFLAAMVKTILPWLLGMAEHKKIRKSNFLS